MKKYLFIFGILMAFCITSCSKDDDDNNSVVGTWKSRSKWDNGKWYKNENGSIHVFEADGTYLYYFDQKDYEAGRVFGGKGTYVYDGKRLSVNGGVKYEVQFSDDRYEMTWVDNYIMYRLK